MATDLDGPHMLPHDQQNRCVVKGRRLDGDTCTVILIRDRAKGAWVLYPHGAAGLGVRLLDVDANALAEHIQGGRS
ncbi:MAG: hypothetical protein LC808_05965 [Actinobacteria bacterium]|nr:hypothetical protein [Actinomycetota bacterium]